MPGLDGFETSWHINKECRHNAPNVIVLSAYTLEEKDKERLKQNHVSDFLSKPARMNEVKEMILSILKH